MTDTSEKGMKVLKASYGTGTTWTDVTKETQSLIKDDNLNFTTDAQTFGILDPAPGVKKTFQAQISINGGKPTLITKDDGEVLDLTVPKTTEKKRDHVDIFSSSFGYFILALLGVYFSYSAYKFGTFGLDYVILGYFVGGIILVLFLSAASSQSNLGFFGLLFSMPFLTGLIPLIVFSLTFIGYHFFNNPNWIQFDKIPKEIKSLPV